MFIKREASAITGYCFADSDVPLLLELTSGSHGQHPSLTVLDNLYTSEFEILKATLLNDVIFGKVAQNSSITPTSLCSWVPIDFSESVQRRRPSQGALEPFPCRKSYANPTPCELRH